MSFSAKAMQIQHVRDNNGCTINVLNAGTNVFQVSYNQAGKFAEIRGNTLLICLQNNTVYAYNIATNSLRLNKKYENNVTGLHLNGRTLYVHIGNMAHIETL